MSMDYGSNSRSSNGGRGLVTVLVIGKTGNGKSSLCNAILGEDLCPVGSGMSSTTLTATSHTCVRGNSTFQVVDTPDITNCHMDPQRRREEVAKWRQLVPHPSVVLLAHRCDERYTPEEHAIYREIHLMWGDNSLRDRLVVAFTFGDLQDNDLEQDLRTACPELKKVLADAQHQYIFFNKNSDDNRKGIAFEMVSALERRKDAGRRRGWPETETGGYDDRPGRHKTSGPPRVVTTILLVIFAIAVSLTIVFIVVGITRAAIAFGVIGFVVAIALVVILWRKGFARSSSP